MTDLASRLQRAGTSLLELREPLAAGEPWPLSAAYGTEPEADWGPREVLAHVGEMLPYWTGELERVLAAEPREPAPFGRVATDANRLARIEGDRRRTTGELLDAIARGLATAGAFVGRLGAADLDRRGAHPARGELTVGASIERFLVAHLEEHLTQLGEILERRGRS